MLEIALYQPDIPQNTATILRLGACLGVTVNIIEPTGFIWSDKALRRAGMDYLDHARIVRHASWDKFFAGSEAKRLVLATTAADTDYRDFRFSGDDIIIFGRESAGVPDAVRGSVKHHIAIAMQAGMRSLNIAMSCAMVTGEALRQLR